MKTAFLLSLLILAQAEYQVSFNEDYCDEDVDTLELAENEIFPTTVVKATLNASTDVEIRATIDAAIELKGLTFFRWTDTNLITPANEPDLLGDKYKIESEYYDTCPVRWYPLYYWRWFFSYPGKYCWAINDVWLTKCTCNFCKMRPKFYEYIYPHLRCMPEYRLSLILAVCWDTEWHDWSKAYLRRHLPHGCCCRHFYKFPMKKPCLLTEDDECE